MKDKEKKTKSAAPAPKAVSDDKHQKLVNTAIEINDLFKLTGDEAIDTSADFTELKAAVKAQIKDVEPTDKFSAAAWEVLVKYGAKGPAAGKGEAAPAKPAKKGEAAPKPAAEKKKSAGTVARDEAGAKVGSSASAINRKLLDGKKGATMEQLLGMMESKFEKTGSAARSRIQAHIAHLKKSGHKVSLEDGYYRLVVK